MRHPAIPPHGPRRTVNGRHGVKLFFRSEAWFGADNNRIISTSQVPPQAFTASLPCGRPVGRARERPRAGPAEVHFRCRFVSLSAYGCYRLHRHLSFSHNVRQKSPDTGGGSASIFDRSFSEADSEGADLPQYRPFSKVLSERAQALAET